MQAAAHTQYLGEITLFFDDLGNLLDWKGHPHYIGNEVEQGSLAYKTFESEIEIRRGAFSIL